MKVKKFSKEWFENKLTQIIKNQSRTPMKLTATKGYKPDLKKSTVKEQQIKSILNLAKEKGIKL